MKKWQFTLGLAVLYVAYTMKKEREAREAMRKNLQWYAREQQKTIDWLTGP